MSKYNIEFPVVLDHLLNSNVASSNPLSNKTEISVCTYYIQGESSLSSLESIASHLDKFLQPIAKSLDTLAFLEWKKSEIIHTCISHYFSKFHSTKLHSMVRHHRRCLSSSNFDHSDKIEMLNRAIEKTKSFVADLIEGHASIHDVEEIFTIEYVNYVNWSYEREVLHDFQKPATTAINVEQSLQATFELIEAYHYVIAMHKTFEKFNMKQCLADMAEIVERVNYVKLEMKTTVTTLDAKEIIDYIMTTLEIDNIMGNPCFCLFAAQRNGELNKLYDFACERGYNSIEHGFQKFRQEHQLVTVDLLHEEHNEKLLSALQNTMNLIFPFFKQSSLLSLLTNIRHIGNLQEALSQISFVNEGMSVIKTWFKRSEVSSSD